MHLLYIIDYEQNYIGQRSLGNSILGKDRIFKDVTRISYNSKDQNGNAIILLIIFLSQLIFIMYLLSANL